MYDLEKQEEAKLISIGYDESNQFSEAPLHILQSFPSAKRQLIDEICFICISIGFQLGTVQRLLISNPEILESQAGSLTKAERVIHQLLPNRQGRYEHNFIPMPQKQDKFFDKFKLESKKEESC